MACKDGESCSRVGSLDRNDACQRGKGGLLQRRHGSRSGGAGPHVYTHPVQGHTHILYREGSRAKGWRGWRQYPWSTHKPYTRSGPVMPTWASWAHSTRAAAGAGSGKLCRAQASHLRTCSGTVPLRTPCPRRQAAARPNAATVHWAARPWCTAAARVPSQSSVLPWKAGRRCRHRPQWQRSCAHEGGGAGAGRAGHGCAWVGRGLPCRVCGGRATAAVHCLGWCCRAIGRSLALTSRRPNRLAAVSQGERCRRGMPPSACGRGRSGRVTSPWQEACQGGQEVRALPGLLLSICSNLLLLF